MNYDKYRNLQYSEASEIQQVQDKLLSGHIEYCAVNSPFYRDFFKKNKVDFRKIKTVSDLKNIPFTEKSDIAANNASFQAVSDTEVVDVCLSSATMSDEPIMIFQTREDIERLSYNEELAFAMAGITENDTLLVCAALDRCFMAGLAYFLGGVKLGTRTVRGGAGSAAQLWYLIEKTKATAIVGVASFMMKIAMYAEENGKKPALQGVKKLISIGEPVRDKSLALLPVSAELEKTWNAELYSTYASSELATSFCECPARRGGHLRPELIVLEIVDKSGNPVPDGETGEVVVTPLGITGMPLVRFKTGDISFIIDEKCSCGRNTVRIGPILGRKGQMLKFRGTTVFPNTILSAIEDKKYIYGAYVEAATGRDGNDDIKLFAALNGENPGIEVLKDEIRARTRVSPEIVIVSKEELDSVVYGSEKKRKRVTFIDRRKNEQ